ncbi:ABC transporter permease, partial [bacterium]|nr:ABC transporter permease [bacterium]
GNGPTDVSISLQVVDRDSGFLSRAFVKQLESGRFDVVAVAPAAADSTAYIRRLIIPVGFTDSVLAHRPVDVALTKKSDSNLEYDAAAEVRLRQVQARFLGALARWNQEAVSEISVADQEALLALIAEQPRLTVAAEFAGSGRPVPSGAGQSIPGMLAMFMVMTVAIGGSESLTREKLGGTLARLATTTYSTGEILGGKLLHLVLVGMVQAMVLMAAGQAIGRLGLFGIDFSWGPRYWVVLVGLVPYAFAVGGVTLLLGGLFRTTQQAESLGWMVGMVFAALGGCWWPLEIMPRGAQILGGFFPTFWAMKALHAVVTFGRGLDGILLPMAVLAG